MLGGHSAIAPVSSSPSGGNFHQIGLPPNVPFLPDQEVNSGDHSQQPAQVAKVVNRPYCYERRSIFEAFRKPPVNSRRRKVKAAQQTSYEGKTCRKRYDQQYGPSQGSSHAPMVGKGKSDQTEDYADDHSGPPGRQKTDNSHCLPVAAKPGRVEAELLVLELSEVFRRNRKCDLIMQDPVESGD